MPKVKAKPLPKKKVQKPVKLTIAERMRQATRSSRSKKPTDQRMREATRIMPKKKARPPMPNDAKPREDAIVPADAPTDYPPVGIAVSTGAAWDTSIDPTTIAMLDVSNNFVGPNQVFTGWIVAQASGGIQSNGGMTVGGSPVVSVAMLDPAVVNARLAALEAALGDVTPPGTDPRSETRSTLTTAAQTNQSDNDLIFEQQRTEAERVQNIFNPPPA